MTFGSGSLSPIALFAYRRPVHLSRTLQALLTNPEASQTELFIFCDAAKDVAAAAGVAAVRDIVQGTAGFSEIHIVFRDSNYGLSRNITEGISEVLSRRDTVIVVEDDIVVSPFFLRFMNDALRLYRDTPQVGSISGYCYPVSMPVPETYFILGSDCWGWATWRDRWREYNPDGQALLAELKARNLGHAFDFDGTMSFVQMLEDQIAGRNDSWAVRWHASCYLKNLFILYPGRALAQNIGHDGSGTHSSVSDDTLNVGLSPTPVATGGIAIQESVQGREAIRQFFAKSAATAVPESIGSAAATPRVAPLPRQTRWRRAARRILPAAVIALLRQARGRLDGRSKVRSVTIPKPVTPALELASGSPYWGLHELDRQIEKYLDFEDGYFVELGANDGRFQSNTLYYEQFRGWRGLLVEPSPELCQRCRESRSSRNSIVNAACVSFGYTDPSVEMIYSNAMSVTLNVETDIGDPLAHAELGRQFLRPDETVFNFQAPARTLNSILLEAGAPARIDFLSLDVEGSEIEVLKGVDHEAFRFRYMLIECRDIARLNEYLGALRYRLVDKFNAHDYLFADQPVTA
jgi:FkbM family methyltransferase